MIESLSHISISSKNLKKVKHFYVDVLKLKIIHEFKNKKGDLYGYFLYAKNKTFLEFFKSKENIKIDKFKLRHICFTVNNIKKMKKKLTHYDKKIEIRRGRSDKVLQFFTKDLENNIIEFHEYDKNSKLFKFQKK